MFRGVVFRNGLVAVCLCVATHGCGKHDDPSETGFGVPLTDTGTTGTPESGTSTASTSSKESDTSTRDDGTSSPNSSTNTWGSVSSEGSATGSSTGVGTIGSDVSEGDTGMTHEEPCKPAHTAATPPLTGPYCVGVTTMKLTDEARSEMYTADPADKRSVLVYLFYPVLPGSTNSPAPWIRPQDWPWLQGYGVSFPPNGYENLWSNAVEDEAVAPGPFPVVFFSPGRNALTSAYTATYVEALVSHGFVVAAINHPHISGPIHYPSGESVPAGSVSNAEIEAASQVGAADARFVLDQLESFNANDPKWMGRVDLSKVGGFGHSMGGIVTVQVLVADDRMIAGGNWDGPMLGNIVTQGTSKPLFMLGSEELGYASLSYDWGLVWDRLSGPGYVAGMAGTTHLGMSDFGLLVQHFGGIPASSGAGSIDPAKWHDISTTFARRFFEAYLLDGDPGEIIAAASSFPEVTLQTK